MRIKEVEIHNILSIEKAVVTFDDSGLMLVEGWNYDVGRANGAGKTAIFNAISYALYGKLPRKVTATEILRRGSSTGSVVVRLEVAGDMYSVERRRPKGVGFTKGGAPLEVTQEGWEKILGLTYEQFILSMYAAQGHGDRFLSANDTGKKQFLLQLLNLEEFAGCKLTADVKVKSLEDAQLANRARIDTVVKVIAAHRENLVDEMDLLYTKNNVEGHIENLTAALQKVQDVPKPDLSKYQKLEDDIAVKRQDFAKVKAKREMLHESYKKVAAKLGDRPQFLDKCRSCGSSLDVTGAKVAHERELGERRAELADLKRAIDDCEATLGGEGAVTELSKKVKERKASESGDYEAARSASSDIKTKLTLRQAELKELVVRLQRNSDIQSKINELQTESEQLVNSGAKISRDIELYKTVSAIYSPTGAQAYILDSVIDSFNERVSQYVGFLWSNMTYQLQSYKENVKGDVSAKFSEHLMMDGKPISIGSLSGGEFRALSLCVDFALVDVMERQFGIPLSPIILDEPFDGLDGAGREFIVELLEKLASDRQIVVIDHASEVKSMFSKVINVEKRHGVSTVSLLP